MVPSVRTEAEEDYDEEGYIPIFVIRRTEGSPFFGSFPFGDNGFPFNFFGDSEERIDGQDTLSDEIIPEIPIIDGFPFNFFGDSEERIDVVDEQDTLSDEIIPDIPIMTSFFDDQSTNVGGVQMDLCGFICNIMKQFDDKLKEIEANIKSIKQDKLQPELNNSTYTEKVLPDGTVVKVNRTIVSDTSEDGNSYFFHSTSFHNVEQADDKSDAVDEVTEESEDEFEEFPIKENDEIPFLDDSLNEVPEDNDEGQRSKRSDPWAQQQLVSPRLVAQQQNIFQHPNQLRRRDFDVTLQWKPIHDDTLVNDLITQNGKRGSLIRIEPESEFIRRNPFTGEVEPASSSRNSNPWAQQEII